MTPKQALMSNPDKVIAIEDRENAKAFLVELGLWGNFRHEHKGVQTQLVVELRQETHFIAAILVAGNSQDKRNGFHISCYPKSQYTEEAFRKIVGEIAGFETKVGKIIGSDMASSHN